MDIYVVLRSYNDTDSAWDTYFVDDEFIGIFLSRNEAVEFAKGWVGDGGDPYSEDIVGTIIHYTDNDGHLTKLDEEEVYSELVT